MLLLEKNHLQGSILHFIFIHSLLLLGWSNYATFVLGNLDFQIPCQECDSHYPGKSENYLELSGNQIGDILNNYEFEIQNRGTVPEQ